MANNKAQFPKRKGKKRKVYKQRAKKRKRYNTGTHKSPKSSKPIKYRSHWEEIVCIHLDLDPLVESYEYETLKIPYISNKRTKKKRHYIPDFLVYYLDGRKVLIEVKPGFKLETQQVIKKAKAAREWAKENNVEYVIWSNEIIRRLKKCQQKK